MQVNNPNFELSIGCAHGDLKVVKYITEVLDFKCSQSHFNIACLKGRLDTVRYLHEKHNMNPDQISLHYAAMNYHSELVMYLKSISKIDFHPQTISSLGEKEAILYNLVKPKE